MEEEPSVRFRSGGGVVRTVYSQSADEGFEGRIKARDQVVGSHGL